MTRWDSFPASEQALNNRPAITTQSVLAHLLETATIGPNIRKNIGGLLKREMNDDQIICYYRNINNDNSPLVYDCTMSGGCCASGCCGANTIYETSSFGWAIALLIVFVLVVVFSLISLLALYLINRHKDRRQRDELASTAPNESPVGSQISGPTYYGNEGYYPYVNTTLYKY